MAEVIRLVPPDEIERNPENPRIIFRQHELQELEDSIASQGILVPLTVFEDAAKLIILDGERRWRCARRLALAKLPVIVQPKPSRMQNIMMMFAIHNTRKEWDPLPTAFKLRDLERLYLEIEGRLPNEAELAQLASLSRGEVRRLKNMLNLPQKYLDELMREAEKPRSEQALTVDHVLEATRGALALRKRDVIDNRKEKKLVAAVIEKYKTRVIGNTTEPRQLARIARAVEREELSAREAEQLVDRIIEDRNYSVSQAFSDSVARSDYEHTLEQQADRLSEKLEAESVDGVRLGPGLMESLHRLNAVLARLLRG